MGVWRSVRRAGALAALPLAVGTAAAADLIEPWSPGFSDAEAHLAWDGHGAGAETAAVLGFGLTPSLSLGATLASDPDGSLRWGFVGIYSPDLGARNEIDLYAEAGATRTEEAELRDSIDWIAGVEWSFHRYAAIPYLRLTAVGDPDSGGFHPLAGVMLPLGSRVELHLEASSESPTAGPWPLHLAAGPNVRVGRGVEILPEISAIHDPGSGRTSWRLALGIVLDPAALR